VTAKKFHNRPVWKMADRMTGGQLADIIRHERKRGMSYDEIMRFLYANYGIEITRTTLIKWGKEIREADEAGEAL